MATRFHSLSLDVTIVLSFYKRSLFSNKSKASNMKTLSENVNLIITDQKCAGVFDNCFNSIVKELNIPIDQNLSNDASIFDDNFMSAVYKHERYPSNFKIKEKVKKHDLFLFYHVYVKDSLKY